MNKPIGIWSAEFHGTNGQAIVTRRVVEKIIQKIGPAQLFVYRPAFSARAVLIWLWCWMKLWGSRLLGDFACLYVVPSRSNAGFVRDMPALVLAKLGTRVVLHVHGSDLVNLLTQRRISGLARWAYKSCEVVVPSRHLLPDLKECESRALYVCENFWNPKDHPTAGDLPKNASELQLLWNSNQIASKGILDVLKAMQSLEQPVQFTLIGEQLSDEEMDRETLSNDVARLITSNQVKNLGSVSRGAADELVQSADAVVLPSRYSSECQPLSVLQAMCLGKALIVSDTPPMRATLGDYPADFVPVHDIDRLAKAIDGLALEKQADEYAFRQKRMDLASVAQDRFSPDRFDHEMHGVLEGSSFARQR